MPNSHHPDNPYHNAINEIDPEEFKIWLEYIDTHNGIQCLFRMTQTGSPNLSTMVNYIMHEIISSSNEEFPRDAFAVFSWRATEPADHRGGQPSQEDGAQTEEKDNAPETQEDAPLPAAYNSNTILVSNDYQDENIDTKEIEYYCNINLEDFQEADTNNQQDSWSTPDLSIALATAATIVGSSYSAMLSYFQPHK